MEAKHLNEFRPNDVMWKNIKDLLRNPDRLLKNTDKRMSQVSSPPANVIRRSFDPYDQMLYHRTILEPHTVYPIPAGTHYIVLTVQNRSLATSTPIHVPAEKTLEEKALPKKRVRITPVMRRVSRRSERPMTPVQIPQPTEPKSRSPDVPPSPVHIPQPPVHIPDVLEPPVQIPVSQAPEPPVQIPDVPEPVQIPISQVPQPPMQILPEPMNILHVSEPVQIPVSQVPQSPMQILHVSEPVQIPVSQVPQSPVQILHVSEPVQIPVSQVPQSPVKIPPVQLLPELDILDPLESTDAFDQLLSFVFGLQENSNCFTRYPLCLMRISSPSWMKGSLWT
ncbi:hypothetical protein TNCV_4857751 [Trichonephila clavipes]|nr:hypothetical protein TNCV_4857751 [Trichonephila clavipes]